MSDHKLVKALKTLVSGVILGGIAVGFFATSQPTVLSEAARLNPTAPATLASSQSQSTLLQQPLLEGEESCDNDLFIRTAEFQMELDDSRPHSISKQPHIVLAQYCPKATCRGECDQCKAEYDAQLADAKKSARDSEFNGEESEAMPPGLLPIAMESATFGKANEADDCGPCQDGKCEINKYDDGVIRVAKRRLGVPVEAKSTHQEQARTVPPRTRAVYEDPHVDSSQVVKASAVGPTYADAEPIQRHNQTCVVRESGDSSPLMTVTLLGKETTSRISTSEMNERKVAAATMRRLPPKPRSRTLQGTPVRKPDYPKLEISSHPQTGRTSIKVRHTSIENILEAVSRRLQIDILRTEGVRGSLSATVVADDLIMALRSLLEPFDFVVIDHSDQLIIRHRNDDSSVVLQSVTPYRPEIQATHSRSEPVPATPAEPVVLANAGSQAMSVPQPLDANQIALAVAQVMQANGQLQNANMVAEVAQPAAESEATPTQPEMTPDVRIAEYAQDAFAAGRTDYAIEILPQGILRYRRSPLLFRLIGEAYFLSGDFQAALPATEQSLVLDKTDPMTNELMARVLLELGQAQRADHYLMQARTLAN